jgi:uncharacterized membrane protein (UPF0127 family)
MPHRGSLGPWLALLLCSLTCGCPSSGGGGAGAEATAKRAEPAPAAPTGSSAPTATAPTTPATPAVVLSPPGREPARVTVELARTEPERRVGLMHRKHLDADAGMLFLFEAPQQLSFWMRNTLVPLDMIFITDGLAVLGVVENAEPLTESPRQVPGISQYVLEVNAGYSRAHGIGAGTMVRFEGVEPVRATTR